MVATGPHLEASSAAALQEVLVVAPRGALVAAESVSPAAALMMAHSTALATAPSLTAMAQSVSRTQACWAVLASST